VIILARKFRPCHQRSIQNSQRRNDQKIESRYSPIITPRVAVACEVPTLRVAETEKCKDQQYGNVCHCGAMNGRRAGTATGAVESTGMGGMKINLDRQMPKERSRLEGRTNPGSSLRNNL
jgi:hypothetical protein